MGAAKKRERYLPPILLTVLYMPVSLVALPIALELARLAGTPTLVLVPLAIVGAYAWAIPRVRRF